MLTLARPDYKAGNPLSSTTFRLETPTTAMVMATSFPQSTETNRWTISGESLHITKTFEIFKGFEDPSTL
jgi:hypothetical protein